MAFVSFKHHFGLSKNGICAMKNVYRRTFKEDRPRVAEVFLAIIEWFSFAEILNSIIFKKKETYP